MNCEDAMKLAYAGLDEPLSPGDEKRLAGHLQGCENCRAELRRLNRLEDVLRNMPEPPVSRARLRETVDAVSTEVRGRRPARGFMWAAVAAAVLIAAGTGLFFRRRPATPTEETSRVSELPTRRAEPSPRPARAQVTAQETDLLVEKLIQADLALSEADGPGQKAAIFCAMSRDVLSMLRELVGRSDGEGTRALGRGYARLVREGVLPNVKLASGERLSQVIGSLRGNCELLESLVADMEPRERTLLAEALSASRECLSEAEGKLGL